MAALVKVRRSVKGAAAVRTRSPDTRAGHRNVPPAVAGGKAAAARAAVVAAGVVDDRRFRKAVVMRFFSRGLVLAGTRLRADRDSHVCKQGCGSGGPATDVWFA